MEEPPRNGPEQELQAVVEFLSFASGKKRVVARPEKELYYGAPGLAVSPDGNSLLYVQVDRDTADIMLVENFR